MTRQEQKEETIRRIRAASIELFVKNGFYGTTTRDIAAAANVSPGLMFHYFPTKEALYTDILRMALGGVVWATGIGEGNGESTNGDGNVTGGIPVEGQKIPDTREAPADGYRVLPLFKGIADNILANCSGRTPAVFVLVKQAQTGTFATAEMKEIIGRMNASEALVPLIQAGQQLGEIREGDPYALAACFFSAIQGIAENAYCYPEIPLPESGWLIDLLRAPAAAPPNSPV